MIGTLEYLEKIRRPDQKVNLLFRFFGIQVREISPDGTVLHAPFQEGFLQGGKVTAGGILATMLDEAMAHAALSTLRPDETTVTVDMHVRYLKPALPERDLIATAKVTRRGRTLIYLESQAAAVEDASEDNFENSVVATATAAFMVLKAKKGD